MNHTENFTKLIVLFLVDLIFFFALEINLLSRDSFAVLRFLWLRHNYGCIRLSTILY